MLAPLEQMTRETRPIEDSLAARCRGADAALAPWCNELRDGVRIVRMRLEHAVTLYRAVLAHDGRVLHRHLPAGKRDEARAESGVALVQRRAPERLHRSGSYR